MAIRLGLFTFTLQIMSQILKEQVHEIKNIDKVSLTAKVKALTAKTSLILK